MSEHDDRYTLDHADARWNGHAPGDLTHAAVLELLAAYTADELEPADHVAIARHLDGCDHCRTALGETQHIRALLATLAEPAPARPDVLDAAPSLADAVLARLASPDEPLVATVSDPFGASTPDDHVPAMHAHASEMRRSPYLAAASVLLVIALGVTLFGFLGPRLRTGADSAIPYAVAAQRAFDREGGVQLDLTVGCLTGEPPCNIDVAMPTLQSILTTRLNGLGIPYALARQSGPADFQVLLPGITDVAGIAPALVAPGRLSILDTGTLNVAMPPPIRLPPLRDPTSSCLAQCLKGPIGGVPPNTWPGTLVMAWPIPPDLRTIRAEVDPQTHQPVVRFAFADPAQRTLVQYARAHEGNYLAVILDLDILPMPILSVMMQASFNGEFTVTGFATLADARAIAAILRSGPLPRTLHLTGERYVAPQAATATTAATASPPPAATPAGTPASLASFGPDAILWSLTMLSPTEGWAAGSTMGPGSGGGLTRTPLLLHYAGGRWIRASDASLAIPDADLSSVSFSSPDEGWAVGNGHTITRDSVLLHFHNGVWQRVRGPANLHIQTALSISSREAWIFGFRNDSGGLLTDQGFILHYLDGSLTEESFHPRGMVVATAMLSAADIWAVGLGPSNALLLHYDGSAWQTVASSIDDLAAPSLYDISFLSPTDGWAVGQSADPQHRSILLHYNGSTWVDATETSAAIGLDRLAMISPSEGWAAGVTGGDASGAPGHSTLYHFDGRFWQPILLTSRAVLSRVVMLSPSEGWAVGYLIRPDNFAGGVFIMRYHDGAWSTYHQ